MKIIYLFHIDIHKHLKSIPILWQESRTGPRNPDDDEKCARWSYSGRKCNGRVRKPRGHNRKSAGLLVGERRVSGFRGDKGHGECRWITKNKEAPSRRGNELRPVAKSSREAAVKKYRDIRKAFFSHPEKPFDHHHESLKSTAMPKKINRVHRSCVWFILYPVYFFVQALINYKSIRFSIKYSLLSTHLICLPQ